MHIFTNIKHEYIHPQRGFSMLELLLVVAIMAILAGIGAPIYQSFMVKNDLDIAVTTVAQSARRAQLLSQANLGDSNWGLYVQSGNITVFKGATYASRDVTYDEVYDVPATITPSGLSEVVFDKLTGDPGTTGTITLTVSVNQVKNITINSKGMVNF